mmetsp:Transcript_70432/g.190458  ORF Transcript_70432/g.190458 Transcript_70432/m.190458 type:complete len:222 (+) Transcript_70432:146-811(+)
MDSAERGKSRRRPQLLQPIPDPLPPPLAGEEAPRRLTHEPRRPRGCGELTPTTPSAWTRPPAAPASASASSSPPPCREPWPRGTRGWAPPARPRAPRCRARPRSSSGPGGPCPTCRCSGPGGPPARWTAPPSARRRRRRAPGSGPPRAGRTAPATRSGLAPGRRRGASHCARRTSKGSRPAGRRSWSPPRPPSSWSRRRCACRGAPARPGRRARSRSARHA